jgi:hypothetical protein
MMLKHEDSQETPLQTAAQVRVTPEELATALSRIEARKDAGQRHADGTIPIGEAMQQLGLEATPEEVLAEVQVGRRLATTQKKRPTHRQRLALLSGIGLGIIVLVGWWSVPHPDASQALPTVSATLSPPQTAPKPISLDPNLTVGDASDKIVVLSEVGDNQPVRCYYGDGSFQPFSVDGSGASWTLIKHSGRVYVRGLMPRISGQALQRDGTDISTLDSSGFVVPITLPLNGFQVMPEVGSNVEFHAVNIRLDKHAYEKWQP